MEGPHHILVIGEIHARLAPDGRIHLGKEGRRHLDEIDAPEVGGRCVAGQIPDHAPAQSNEQVCPVEMAFDEDGIEAFDILKGL